MIFETIALLALLAAGVAAVATWDEIRSWARRQAYAEAARLIRKEIANNNVEVVSIALNARGQEVARQSTRAKSLDPTLTGMFGAANTVTVRI